MIKQETLADLLFDEINSSSKGDKNINTIFTDWKTDVYVKWNLKNVDLKFMAEVPKFHIHFEDCLIKKDHFISLVARYDNYKFQGNSSSISDLLLQSPNSRNLLKARKASFELKDKNLIYNVRLKKKDKISLSNVITLIKNLTEQVNMII